MNTFFRKYKTSITRWENSRNWLVAENQQNERIKNERREKLGRMGAGDVRGASWLAARQRVHSCVVPTPVAIDTSLSQVHVQDPQRDREHLDSLGGGGDHIFWRLSLLVRQFWNGHFGQIYRDAGLDFSDYLLLYIHHVPHNVLPLGTDVHLQRKNGLLGYCLHLGLQLLAMDLLPI